MNCKSFRWYLENVYPELTVPVKEVLPGIIKQGMNCLESQGQNTAGDFLLGMGICRGSAKNPQPAQAWLFSDHLIQQQGKCLAATSTLMSSPGSPVTLQMCNPREGKQEDRMSSYPTANTFWNPSLPSWSPAGPVSKASWVSCIREAPVPQTRDREAPGGEGTDQEPLHDCDVRLPSPATLLAPHVIPTKKAAPTSGVEKWPHSVLSAALLCPSAAPWTCQRRALHPRAMLHPSSVVMFHPQPGAASDPLFIWEASCHSLGLNWIQGKGLSPEDGLEGLGHSGVDLWGWGVVAASVEYKRTADQRAFERVSPSFAVVRPGSALISRSFVATQLYSVFAFPLLDQSMYH
ncbi:hypothetical protein P7K49_018249 [Saguinus oedipus]|uniref:Ricin B lectin domain-containing protein n=1 Tax=Saguinus oedipus TaxID=9490 RepID=A0ABQ9V6V3_SAGOE|nr:hypothetical protein P7K49_018249 [Saguinus oedipus]